MMPGNSRTSTNKTGFDYQLRPRGGSNCRIVVIAVGVVVMVTRMWAVVLWEEGQGEYLWAGRHDGMLSGAMRELIICTQGLVGEPVKPNHSSIFV